jgi:GT2 family glycosyltransferase
VNDVLPVSVVVPTIGRPARLEECLHSVAQCSPRAAEIIVVDQSGDPSTGEVVTRFDHAGAHVIPCEPGGVSRGTNVGLESASNEVVLVTHDDCTVSSSWVARAWKLMSSDPDRIVSGRVLPAGDLRKVPSTRDDPLPREYVGRVQLDALFPNNMIVNGAAVLAFGGFDERFTATEAAEDMDFCYRWLRSGRRISYEPELLVWHSDWRSDEQLERLCVDYWRGGGFFHAKHLRRGDLRIVPFILRDLRAAGRGLTRRLLPGRRVWWDEWHGFTHGYVGGLIAGWRDFGSTGQSARPAAASSSDRRTNANNA